MNGASPRCYANADERGAVLCESQAIAKREGRGYLACDRNGLSVFGCFRRRYVLVQEEVSNGMHGVVDPQNRVFLK